MKNIQDALYQLEPEDKIVTVIDNKFAVINKMFENGNFDNKNYIVSLDNHKIFLVAELEHFKNINKSVQMLDNISYITIQTNIVSGKKHNRHYLTLLKVQDRRKYKHLFRRLEKSLIKKGLIS